MMLSLHLFYVAFIYSSIYLNSSVMHGSDNVVISVSKL